MQKTINLKKKDLIKINFYVYKKVYNNRLINFTNAIQLFFKSISFRLQR